MEKIEYKILTGERALYNIHNAEIENCIFQDGESPLKESSDLQIKKSMFKWKYPLWYVENAKVSDTTWFDMARAGVWYCKNIEVENCTIEAPKNFRRVSGLKMNNVSMPNAEETLWKCSDVEFDHVVAKGDYFGMNSENVVLDHFTLYGNYSFDGVKNIHIKNSTLLSKDAFWNCENVLVENSFISGEYLAWNSKNVTFKNCRIQSLQGLCYIDNLVMENCTLLDTDLAFELSTVQAEINSSVKSIKNPISGTIKVKEAGEIIMDKEIVDPSKTEIIITGKE